MVKKTKIVILAAGQGTRMQSELPKVLVTLHDKPMIKYVLDAVNASQVDSTPVIIVGHRKDEIIAELVKDGREYTYVTQHEQLGTGHAVATAESALKGKADNVIVLPSDHPFLTPETIQNLNTKQEESGATITMATTTVSDFEDWRRAFYKSFSRIIRNESGKIIRDVQFRDATDKEKEIKELNPIYFCFKADWLWENLRKLNTHNDQKQYYLTDLVKIAMENGEKIESINISPREALAANSKEELELLEKVAK